MSIESGAPSWLKLEKQSLTLDDVVQPVVRLVKTSERTAELSIQNDSKIDVYTWALNCNVPFTIEAGESDVENDFFVYIVMFPEHKRSKIE